MQFFRGNTHTHTLWSDGDAAPEMVTAWYRERDFDFLVLSEHNTMAIGTRWFEVKEGTRLTDERLRQLEDKFGPEAIEVRDRADGGLEMRLQTLEELRARFEAPGEFLMITGEEITDSYEGANVHVNGINLTEVVKPQHGDTLTETVSRNVDAAAAQGASAGRSVLSHLNHPNFTWSLGWEDFATVPGLQFFEVYNGHPSVHNLGDAERPATERMWDFVNTRRLREPVLPLMYGVATDDAHNYHEMKIGRSNPGRGYVQVAASTLEPNAIVEAMQAGQFYGSSGVDLLYFEADATAFKLEVIPEEGVLYRVQFFGTRCDNGTDHLQVAVFFDGWQQCGEQLVEKRSCGPARIDVVQHAGCSVYQDRPRERCCEVTSTHAVGAELSIQGKARQLLGNTVGQP